MIILYGLSTCDTVKKARYWLNVNQISYQWYEIRRDGIPLELLQKFAAQLNDWQVLVNRKGSTWRKFTPEQQQLCSKIETALPLIIEYPTLMKRPVLDTGKELVVGFDIKIYETLLL